MEKTAQEAIRLRTSGKAVVVDFLRGELKDEREILRLLEKLGELLDKRQKVNLVLNLEKLTYVSSAGIGAFVKLLKRVSAQNGTLCLCRVAGDVQEVLQVMHLDKIIGLHATEEEALAAL